MGAAGFLGAAALFLGAGVVVVVFLEAAAALACSLGDVFVPRTLLVAALFVRCVAMVGLECVEGVFVLFGSRRGCVCMVWES